MLVVAFAIGIGLRRVPAVPESMPQALNAYIIHVALPALVLLHVPRLAWEPSLIGPVLMPWLFMALTIGVVTVVCRVAGWSRATWGALVLTAGLGNTSFVGLPMIEAFHGTDALPLGLLIDQFGSFIMVSTVGLGAAAWAAGQDTDLRRILRRIALFPPFIALLVALILRWTGPLPEVLLEVLDRLGATLAPLALLSVGMQLRLGALRAQGGALVFGLGWKLLVAPAIILGVYGPVLGYEGVVLEVTLLEAAMAPMITGSIVAAEYRLRPELASLMVGVGIPLSFLTAAFWMWVV